MSNGYDREHVSTNPFGSRNYSKNRSPFDSAERKTPESDKYNVKVDWEVLAGNGGDLGGRYRFEVTNGSTGLSSLLFSDTLDLSILDSHGFEAFAQLKKEIYIRAWAELGKRMYNPTLGDKLSNERITDAIREGRRRPSESIQVVRLGEGLPIQEGEACVRKTQENHDPRLKGVDVLKPTDTISTTSSGPSLSLSGS